MIFVSLNCHRKLSHLQLLLIISRHLNSVCAHRVLCKVGIVFIIKTNNDICYVNGEFCIRTIHKALSNEVMSKNKICTYEITHNCVVN